MNTYKIEDVSRECGLTKRTIRYYEEIGLLFPPERSEGGYRLYSDRHIERLKQITIAKDVLGSSLQDLQEFVSISEEFENHRQGYRQTEDDALKREKLAEIEKIVGKQLQIIDQKLEKLMAIRRDMDQLYNRVLEAKAKLK
ncbi:MerR family transcriptional regulator [Paenibacillus sediminis]|uniref:DNA-binding transcriptional MerR regulator n=1 Tax=Paenibacillus sediminis TaxID=664909 RepID=A0ABS4H456_9BACL|nr:MerR family transcriptional regulator [Paenibacillus sediminis]MBP1937236.1 DNA-binding transcriptional MerR regulator [Paenibacillus sediminis]